MNKLLVNEWFKTYEVMKVNKNCFDNSPNIEICGTMTAFKIKDDFDLNFRINVLKEKGFNLVVL